MAVVGNIAIGMSVASSGVSKGLAQGRAAIGDFASSLTSTGTLITGVFAGAGVAAIYKMAGAAAHLSEAGNKVDAIFKDQSGSIKNASKALSDAYGMSLTETLDKTSQLGAMFGGAGFSSKAAANYSETFARLANDLSRFNDVSFETAFDKIRAGLSGESEPLRQFGIFLTEDAVKAEAYRTGLAKVGQDLSEAAKIQARANIIMSKSGPAIGTAAKEANGASSQIEAFGGRWENLTTTIGEVFAPVVGAALGSTGDLLKWLSDSFSANKDSVMNWGKGVLSAMGISVEGTSLLQTAIGFLGESWDVLGLAFKAVQTGITSGLATIVDGLTYLGKAFDWLYQKTTGGSSGLTEFLTTYADELHKLSESQASDFQKALAAPSTGEALKSSFAASQQQLDKLRQDLASKPLELVKDTGAKGTADKLTAQKAAKPFADALKFGSADTAETILKNRYGTGKKDEVASNTKSTAEGIKELVKLTKANNKTGALPVFDG